MDILAVVKEHPVPIIGAAVVLVLLMMRGGSSSTASSGASAAYSAGLQSQALNAQTNVQLSTIAAQDSAARAGYTADMFKTSAALSAANTSAGVSAIASYFQHADNQTSMADNLTLQNSTIAASHDVAIQTLATNLQANTNNNNTQLSALAASLGMQKYTIDATTANLPSMLQYSTNIAGIQASSAQQLAVISGQNAQAIASINTAAARTTANASANASNVSSAGSLLGTLGTAAMMFL